MLSSLICTYALENSKLLFGNKWCFACVDKCLLRKEVGYVCFHRQWTNLWIVPSVRATGLIDQKLGEIPRDVVNVHRRPRYEWEVINHIRGRRAGSSQELINRMDLRWIPINMCLLEKGEIGNVAASRTHVFQTIQNLRVSAGFLIFKLRSLPTWKAQDDKPGKFQEQLVQLYVVDDSHTSERGYVGNQNDLPAELRELDRATAIEDRSRKGINVASRGETGRVLAVHHRAQRKQ